MVLKVGDDIAAQADLKQSVFSVDSKSAFHTLYNNLGDDDDDGKGSPALELPDSIEKDLSGFTFSVDGLMSERHAELLDDEGVDASEEEDMEEDLIVEIDPSDETGAALDSAALDADNGRVDLYNDDTALDPTDEGIAADQERELNLSDDNDEDDADEEGQEDDLEFSDDEEDEQFYEMPDLAQELPRPAYVQFVEDDTDEEGNNEFDELGDKSEEDIEDEAVVLADKLLKTRQDVKGLNGLPHKLLSSSAGFFCDKTKCVDDSLVFQVEVRRPVS